jgi:hypothetical protein
MIKVDVAARADDKAILKLLANDFGEISIEETCQIGGYHFLRFYGFNFLIDLGFLSRLSVVLSA